MRLEQLIAYFETSPALKLLRSQNAPFVLDFLHQQFKGPGHISSAASELSTALNDYCESLHETYPDALRDKPEQYLAAWCAGETRWLHRSLEAGRNEPVYQLTPHTEDVFVFLDRALQKDLGFVGTESRLKLVISTLADLVAGASRNPDVRLSQLREEKKRIDDEIAAIVRDGAVAARYEPAAVRERFATAVAMLKELLADFRAVEDRFREITRQVQKRQLDGTEARGSILEFALDAEDVLKKDDQGVSFYEFFRFILSPLQHERLQVIITELGRIEELSQQRDGLATVRRMVPSLIADAEKVMRTNQRLSATLRRLLDARTASDRRRLAQLLAEVRALAARMADDPPMECDGASVDVGVQLNVPFSRTFWNPPKPFARVDLIEEVTDDKQRLKLFQMLAQLHRLDWKVMRQRVRELTRRRGRSISLAELIEEFPPSAGAIELLGYIQIANDDGHVVKRNEVEEIRLQSTHNSPTRTLTVPRVIFLASSESANVGF